jgi:hypothetical protein
MPDQLKRGVRMPLWAVVLLAVALIVSAWVNVAATASRADAQVIPGRHFACYPTPPPGGNPWVPWQYLPNGASPCPSGWNKIDWIDD